MSNDIAMFTRALTMKEYLAQRKNPINEVIDLRGFYYQEGDEIDFGSLDQTLMPGFSKEEAVMVLQQLAELEIHSIEQPIKAGHLNDMAELCAATPTPIALDEELIGITDLEEKKKLLEIIKPQYIILKPALVGGFAGSDEWISLAEAQHIGWWITSALESNIGLNAIAQYTFTKQNPMPQGLGTGALFVNNFESSLDLRNELLWFKK